MAGILVATAVCFHSSLTGSSTTTVPRMVTLSNGAPLHMTSKKTGNGGCATIRNKGKRFSDFLAGSFLVKISADL